MEAHFSIGRGTLKTLMPIWSLHSQQKSAQVSQRSRTAIYGMIYKDFITQEMMCDWDNRVLLSESTIVI
ncbi:hypothetical protein CYMTET_48331 [Cymbomonas tetramitiformis]|uniref:Uncharacterized protein n=1 Tax=Cymbomonas tetramitiformis TaxID=36881 RepID=A0AAE0EVQ1_9CHLO|nr:hypothetical protein CYMTET_48331 [Cymbomonas tetramitiformis]